MSIHIQNYMRGGGTCADLLATFGIVAKRHRQYPKLVQFKYDQIRSPMAEPIVRE